MGCEARWALASRSFLVRLACTVHSSRGAGRCVLRVRRRVDPPYVWWFNRARSAVKQARQAGRLGVTRPSCPHTQQAGRQLDCV